MKRLFLLLTALCPLLLLGQSFTRTAAFKGAAVRRASAALTPDIFWWKLNDGSGTNIIAAVGQTGTNNCSWVANATGYELLAQYPTNTAAADGNVVYGTNKLTATFWVKNTSGKGTTVITSTTGDWSSYNSWVFDVVSGGVTWVRMRAPGAGKLEATTSPLGTNEVHVALVFDSAAAGNVGAVTVYYNGVEQGVTNVTTTKTQSNAFDSRPLCLMRSGSTGDTSITTDDVRVFSGALSSAQIAAIYADHQ